MASNLIKEPFVNELGQTINPGDEVMFVATSWKNTRVDKGIFEGVYKGSGYYSTKDSNGVTAVLVRRVGEKKYSWERMTSILEQKRVYKLDTSALDMKI